ncbi:MAG: diguanylate cyclase [Proteobacteria bacterium]|nr:diguanylate cyclase [Pseudomonadota bacterium]MBU1389252.1 diguanylate cyclase [Pseudomonadota bacterium]MBU1544072.1 diguanylate cyclase [Pseudomonadota bacterium]MBU2430458.1 diguanylate cyclase [Pseudomonadota bacterium]MBU2482078.1 diguanylate cyclase [Pseudomonadota bacterium]
MNERRQSEKARLESLLKISQYNAISINDLLDFALSEAIVLTQSKIGYIYFYNEETFEFTLNTWSKGVMDICDISDRQTVYSLDKTGIWGEAVRQRQPVVVNDYSAVNPLKKGYPEGHAPLFRFMTLPVFFQKTIVAVLGLANKDDDYSNTDLQQASLLMSSVWQIAERKRFEDELRKSEEKYRSILENIKEGYFESDPDGNIQFVNNAALIMMGRDRKTLYEINYRHFTSPETAEKFKKIYRMVLKTGAYSQLDDYEIIRGDGTVRIHQLVAGPIRDKSGRITGSMTVARDVTEQKQAAEALEKSEERIRLLFNSIPVPTFVWKLQEEHFVLAEFNTAALQLIGDRIQDHAGKTADIFFKKNSQIQADIRKCLETKNTVENQFWYLPDDVVNQRYFTVKYAWAPPDSVLMHVNDITVQKQTEEKLYHISIHDSLTGLFNRLYADAEITRLDVSRIRPVSIIIIDLNDLKKVNDKAGHAMGDQYIKDAAFVLKKTFRPEDMVARIGGDEFLILLPLVDGAICETALLRLQNNIRFFNAESQKTISLSAGFTTVCSEDKVSEKIREADARMYQQKALMKMVHNSVADQ